MEVLTFTLKNIMQHLMKTNCIYLSNLLHQLLLPKQKDKFHETHFPWKQHLYCSTIWALLTQLWHTFHLKTKQFCSLCIRMTPALSFSFASFSFPRNYEWKFCAIILKANFSTEHEWNEHVNTFATIWLHIKEHVFKKVLSSFFHKQSVCKYVVM